jgi:hypothetical protein
MPTTLKRVVNRPENKNEENEETEEHGNVVHGSEHHNQLVAQCRHETDLNLYIGLYYLI